MNLTSFRIFFFFLPSFPSFSFFRKVANFSRYHLYSDGTIVLFGGGEIVEGGVERSGSWKLGEDSPPCSPWRDSSSPQW